MKLKLFVLMLMVCLMAGSTYAATVGNWASGTKGGTGLWSNAAKWSAGTVPGTTALSGDEIKISQTNAPDITIDGTAVLNYDCRLSTGSNAATSGVTLRIVSGADFGMGEFRVGSRGVSSSADAVAYAYQTGGKLTVGDLVIGRYASGGGSVAQGFYTISAGTIQNKTAGSYVNNGRLFVGSNSGSAGYNGAQGTFTVDGAGGTISMKKLYVGAQSTAAYGTGTLEFKIGASGVSKIQLADNDSIQLDLAGASSTAILTVSMTTAITADTVLVENLGTGAVANKFDSLNGGLAYEGTCFGIGANNYYLTYRYDAATGTRGTGNDIALLIPEPATIALLSLGLLAIRRKK